MKYLVTAATLAMLATPAYAGSKLPQALQNIYCMGTSCAEMKSDHVRWSNGTVCKFIRVYPSKDSATIKIRCPDAKGDSLIILNSDGTISEPPCAH
jgi:hypothetical protein